MSEWLKWYIEIFCDCKFVNNMTFFQNIVNFVQRTKLLDCTRITLVPIFIFWNQLSDIILVYRQCTWNFFIQMESRWWPYKKASFFAKNHTSIENKYQTLLLIALLFLSFEFLCEVCNQFYSVYILFVWCINHKFILIVMAKRCQ